MEKELRQQNVALLNVMLKLINVSSKYSGEFYCLMESSDEDMKDLVQQKYSIKPEALVPMREAFRRCDDQLIQKINALSTKLFPKEFELMIKMIKEMNEDENCGTFLQTHFGEMKLSETQKECIKTMFKDEFFIHIKDHILEKENERIKYEQIISEKETRIKQLEEEIEIALNNNYEMENVLKEREEILEEYWDHCFDDEGNQREFKTRESEIKKMDIMESLAQQVGQLQKIVEEKDKEIVYLQNKNNELKDGINESEELIKLKERVGQLEEELSKNDQENRELDESMRKLEIELEKKENENMEYQIELETKARDCETKEMQLVELEKRMEEMTETKLMVDTLQVLIEEMNLKLRDKDKELALIRDELGKKENELKMLKEEVNKQRISIENKIDVATKGNDSIPFATKKGNTKGVKVEEQEKKVIASTDAITIKDHTPSQLKKSIKDKIALFENVAKTTEPNQKFDLKKSTVGFTRPKSSYNKEDIDQSVLSQSRKFQTIAKQEEKK